MELYFFQVDLLAAAFRQIYGTQKFFSVDFAHYILTIFLHSYITILKSKVCLIKPISLKYFSYKLMWSFYNSQAISL